MNATYTLKTDGGPNATIKAANRAEAVTAAMALMTREGFADGDVTADDAGWCDGEIRFIRVGRADGYTCASLVDDAFAARAVNLCREIFGDE